MSSAPSGLPEDNQSVTISFELLPGVPISTGAVIMGCARKRELSVPMKEQLLLTLRVFSLSRAHVESPESLTKAERGYQSELRQAEAV